MLSRNNEFIVFYRGKDFLSSELAEVLLLVARSIELQRHQVLFRFCGGLLKVQRTYVGCSKTREQIIPCSVLIMVIYRAYIFFS